MHLNPPVFAASSLCERDVVLFVEKARRVLTIMDIEKCRERGSGAILVFPLTPLSHKTPSPNCVVIPRRRIQSSNGCIISSKGRGLARR